jgi:hypothetical protein
MNLRKVAGGLALAGLTAGLAACGSGSNGSGSSGGSTTTSVLAKPALIARANTICSTAQSASSAVTAPASYADPTVAAAYFDKIAPITHKETQDLLALRPASDVASAYATFTAAQQASDALLATIRQKADAKDPSGQQDLAKAPAVGQKVADAATALGATVCAQ